MGDAFWWCRFRRGILPPIGLLFLVVLSGRMGGLVFCPCCLEVFNSIRQCNGVVIDGRNVIHSRNQNLGGKFNLEHAIAKLSYVIDSTERQLHPQNPDIAVVIPKDFYDMPFYLIPFYCIYYYYSVFAKKSIRK